MPKSVSGSIKGSMVEGNPTKPLIGFALPMVAGNLFQQFYNIMNGMLINESVYMPLLHFILPFQYEDNNVMSEMWVDPDAKRDNEDGGRKIKLFLKFDIQSLGKFELLMIMQDRETRLQLLVPPQLAKDEKKIHTEVADILKRNGFRFSQLLVRERVRDRRVDEVFPEIREKERTINVRK